MNVVRENLKNHKVNENIKELKILFCDIKEKLWKAARVAKYSTKLSVEGHILISKTFSWIEVFLSVCGDLIKKTLELVNFVSDSIQIDETKAKLFFTKMEYLLKDHEKSVMDSEKLFSASNEIRQIDIIKSDLSAIENGFDSIFHEFECTYGNDFYNIVVNAYSDINERLQRNLK